MQNLTIAVAKGRLQTEALDLLARAGLSVSSEMLASRRLAVEDESGRCRMVVAAPSDMPLSGYRALRVATKYPRVTARHFASRGLSVEIIQLSGSVEVAPLLGLADCIVDLVETGRTLLENGLAMVEVIAESTARLVINRASYQLKAEAVAHLIDSLSEIMDQGERS